jgi:hypothetical protein
VFDAALKFSATTLYFVAAVLAAASVMFASLPETKPPPITTLPLGQMASDWAT